MTDENRKRPPTPPWTGTTELDEISLRQFIETLLKHKVMIIAAVFTVLILTAIITFVVFTPIYETSATIRIQIPEKRVETSQSQITLVLSDHLEIKEAIRLQRSHLMSQELLDSLSFLGAPESMDATEIQSRLTSNARLSKMINELDLDPPTHTAASLSRSIQVQQINDNNVYRVVVRGNNAETPVKIANFLIEEFETVVDDSIHDQFQTVSRIEALIESTQEDILQLSSAVEAAVMASDHSPEAFQTNRMRLELSLLEDLHENLVLQAAQRTWLSKVEPLDKDVVMLSPAENAVKVSPHAGLNLAVALALGLILGGFAAFLTEYWKKSSYHTNL